MHWMDMLKFQPLVDRLEEFDREIDDLYAHVAAAADPIGVLDDIESLVGDAFMACQIYMIERKGESEPAVAYACGPRHRTRYTAQVIAAAGNFHKHRGEWSNDESCWKRQQQVTAAVLRDAGVADPDFWLFQVLTHMTGTSSKRFAKVVPMLVEWREAFDRLPRVPSASALTPEDARSQ